MGKLKKSLLFRRVFYRVLIIFVTTLMGISLLFGWTLYDALLDEYRSKGVAITQSISDSSVNLLLNQNEETIQSIVNQYLEIDGVAYVVVQNYNREIVSHTFVPALPDEIDFNSTLTTELQVSKQKVSRIGTVLHITSPIVFGEIGWVTVGMKVSSIIGLIQWSLVKLVLVMGGIFLVSILGLFQMIRKISLPLNELTEYAENLSQHHFESPSTYYDAITQLSQTSTDEIGKLSQAFVRLEKDLISYIENLKTTTSEKEKIESELAIARDIQMSFLPKAVNQSGPNYELDIVPFIQPAKEVGGDFYDIIMKPSDNRLFMAMGDVSGKGTPAALFMAKTATLLRATIAHNQSPSEILSIVNQELCHGNDNCLFVTVFLGELNLTTGELTYCLAGHPPAYIVNQSTVTALPLVQGMALGIESHVFFQSNVVTLSPEDRLFLYTDGMTDMTNDDQEMYTESGLELFLKRTSNEGMKETQGLLESEIDQFTGQAPQYDDITTMMVQWSSKAVTVSEKLSVFFENELSELVKLQQVIQLYGQSNQLSDTLQNSINLVLEELLTNIISYGYEDHDSHKIYLHLSLKEGVLTAVIEDDGIPFNPLEAPDVDVSQSIEDISVGGLGIHFVRTLMDDLYYERKQNKNNLTMTKRLVASDLKEEQS